MRGRLKTLILGDLGKHQNWMSLDGGVREAEGEEGGDGAGDLVLAASHQGGGPLSSDLAAGITLPSAAEMVARNTQLTLRCCDLSQAVTLLGGSDGAALRCLARLGLHLTLRPDTQITHSFYVTDIVILPHVDWAAGAGGAAAVAEAAGTGSGGSVGQQSPTNDDMARLLGFLARIQLDGVGLVSLLPADTLSVGFPARLHTAVGCGGTGAAAAKVLQAMGAAGLSCRRLLLDAEGHAKRDQFFMRDAVVAAMMHLAPHELCTCWEHLAPAWAPTSLAAALKARADGTGSTSEMSHRAVSWLTLSVWESMRPRLPAYLQTLSYSAYHTMAMGWPWPGSSTEGPLQLTASHTATAIPAAAAAAVMRQATLSPPSILGGGSVGSTGAESGGRRPSNASKPASSPVIFTLTVLSAILRCTMHTCTAARCWI